MTISNIFGTLPEIQDYYCKVTWLVSRENIVTESQWKLPAFITNDIRPRYFSVHSPISNLIDVLCDSFYRRNMRSDMQTREHDTGQGNVVIMLESSTWPALGSNLGQTTGYSDWCLCGFSQFHQARQYDRLPHQTCVESELPPAWQNKPETTGMRCIYFM